MYLKYRGEHGMTHYQILKLISLYRYALVGRYVHMSVEVVTSNTYTQQTPGKKIRMYSRQRDVEVRVEHIVRTIERYN
jgi:hypothetical protein